MQSLKEFYKLSSRNMTKITWSEFPEVVEVSIQMSIISSKYIQVSIVGNCTQEGKHLKEFISVRKTSRQWKWSATNSKDLPGLCQDVIESNALTQTRWMTAACECSHVPGNALSASQFVLMSRALLFAPQWERWAGSRVWSGCDSAPQQPLSTAPRLFSSVTASLGRHSSSFHWCWLCVVQRPYVQHSIWLYNMYLPCVPSYFLFQLQAQRLTDTMMGSGVLWELTLEIVDLNDSTGR